MDMVTNARRKRLGLRTLKMFAVEGCRARLVGVEAVYGGGGVVYVFVPVTTPLSTAPERPPFQW